MVESSVQAEVSMVEHVNAEPQLVPAVFAGVDADADTEMAI
jgi:hypothetical protein